jgi:hypothetical protein
MRLFSEIDLQHQPFDSPEEMKQYAAWSAWAEDPKHLRMLAHASDQDVADEVAAIMLMDHEEAGNCIDFLCHALIPVTGSGFELPEGAGPILQTEPEWHERALTREEASRIEELTDILLRQAQRTETPGYDPDNP